MSSPFDIGTTGLEPNLESGSCDYCRTAGSNCSDLHNYYLAGSITTCFGSLFVIFTYLTNERLRKHPSILIFCRCIFDFFFGLYFLIIASLGNQVHILTCRPSVCTGMGAMLLFSFLGSQGYFAANIVDLYQSMRHPFGSIDANVKRYHIAVWSYASIITIIMATSGQLAWRKDLEICWVKAKGYDESVNPLSSVFLYVPTALVTLVAVIVVINAWKRLRQGLPDTFDVRMKTLRDSLFYTVFFTVYFAFAWLFYFLIWIDVKDKNTSDDSDVENKNVFYYMFALTFGCLGVVDSTLWGIRKYWYDKKQQVSEILEKTGTEIRVLSDRQSNNGDELNSGAESPMHGFPVSPESSKSAKKHTSLKSLVPPKPARETLGSNAGGSPRSSSTRVFGKIGLKQSSDGDTINKALRREVLAYTTDGIAQSVERAKMIASKAGIDANEVPRVSHYPMSMRGTEPPTCVQRFKITIRYNCELLGMDRPPSRAPAPSATATVTQTNTAATHAGVADIYSSMSTAATIDQHSFPAEHTMNDTVTNLAPVSDLEPNHEQSWNPFAHHGPSIFSSNSTVDGSAAASREFTDYAPMAFRFLRMRLLGMNDKEYIESIIPSTHAAQKDVLDAKYSEGRSGAFFYFTHDSKFLVKTVTKKECQFFISILRQYVEYLHDNPDSSVNTFLGLHSCRMYNLTLYFVVMKNIFLADLKPQEVYDLKGSWIARHTRNGIASGKIMKDMDLNRYVILSATQREAILEQLEKDTRFLSQLNIMDYSLLLGIYYMKLSSLPPINEMNKATSIPQTRAPNPSVLSTFSTDDNVDIDDDDDDNDGNDDTTLLQSFNGGVRAQVIEGPGIYYMGVIDTLQNWNLDKKAERFAKTMILRKDKHGISAIEPIKYQKRFMAYMRSIMITDEEFFDAHNITATMFRPQTMFAYPTGEMVDDNIRRMRSTTLRPTSTEAIGNDNRGSHIHMTALRPSDVAPAYNRVSSLGVNKSGTTDGPMLNTMNSGASELEVVRDDRPITSTIVADIDVNDDGGNVAGRPNIAAKISVSNPPSANLDDDGDGDGDGDNNIGELGVNVNANKYATPLSMTPQAVTPMTHSEDTDGDNDAGDVARNLKVSMPRNLSVSPAVIHDVPSHSGDLSENPYHLHEPIEPSMTTSAVYSYGPSMLFQNPPTEKSEAVVGGGIVIDPPIANTLASARRDTYTLPTNIDNKQRNSAQSITNTNFRENRGFSAVSADGGNLTARSSLNWTIRGRGESALSTTSDQMISEEKMIDDNGPRTSASAGYLTEKSQTHSNDTHFIATNKQFSITPATQPPDFNAADNNAETAL